MRGRRRQPVWGAWLGACTAAAALAAAAAGPAAAQQASREDERFAMAPASRGALWRLDTRTGALCVFEFTGSQPGGAVLNAGCLSGDAAAEPGAEVASGVKRYALLGRGGGEVWRLDSRTGRVCVFGYRPVFPTSPVVAYGCSARGEPKGQ